MMRMRKITNDTNGRIAQMISDIYSSVRLASALPRSVPLCFCGFLILLCCVSAAYAADVDLEINTGATYDTNVYRNASPEDDTYFTLAPRVALKLPLDKLYFGSGVRAAVEQHVNMADANLQELVLSGIGRYSPSDYLSFGLLDDVIISDRLTSAEKLTDVTQKREFVDNRFLSAAKYVLNGGALAASLEYASIIRDYRDTEYDDWIAHSTQFSVEYFLGHKTSTQVDFGVIRKVYELDIDYVSFPITASLKRKLGSKIDAKLLLGLESRGYNEVYRDRDLDKPTASLEIVGDMASNTDLKLSLQRRLYDSDYETGYAFMSMASEVELALRLSNSVRLVLQGLYSGNSYMGIQREDDVFGWRGEVRYGLSEWGSVVVSYDYERRYSSVPQNDYGKHMVDLSYVALF